MDKQEIALEQIRTIKEFLSQKMPDTGFGEFVRDILFQSRFDAIPEIDWLEMTRAMGYHFTELGANPEFRAIWNLTQE